MSVIFKIITEITYCVIFPVLLMFIHKMECMLLIYILKVDHFLPRYKDNQNCITHLKCKTIQHNNKDHECVLYFTIITRQLFNCLWATPCSLHI